jgi:hypothetical protein
VRQLERHNAVGDRRHSHQEAPWRAGRAPVARLSLSRAGLPARPAELRSCLQARDTQRIDLDPAHLAVLSTKGLGTPIRTPGRCAQIGAVEACQETADVGGFFPGRRITPNDPLPHARRALSAGVSRQVTAQYVELRIPPGQIGERTSPIDRSGELGCGPEPTSAADRADPTRRRHEEDRGRLPRRARRSVTAPGHQHRRGTRQVAHQPYPVAMRPPMTVEVGCGRQEALGQTRQRCARDASSPSSRLHQRAGNIYAEVGHRKPAHEQLDGNDPASDQAAQSISSRCFFFIGRPPRNRFPSPRAPHCLLLQH